MPMTRLLPVLAGLCLWVFLGGGTSASGEPSGTAGFQSEAPCRGARGLVRGRGDSPNADLTCSGGPGGCTWSI